MLPNLSDEQLIHASLSHVTSLDDRVCVCAETEVWELVMKLCSQTPNIILRWHRSCGRLWERLVQCFKTNSSRAVLWSVVTWELWLITTLNSAFVPSSSLCICQIAKSNNWDHEAKLSIKVRCESGIKNELNITQLCWKLDFDCSELCNNSDIFSATKAKARTTWV